MGNIERPQFVDKLRQSFDMISLVRTQSSLDKKAVIGWGIDPNLQPGGTRFLLTYIPAYFLDRFSTEELREMRFFESLTKFVFYVITIGDDLLDNGVNFYGAGGNVKLIRSIPRTLMYWKHLYFEQLKEARKREVVIPSLLSVPLNFTSIISRRLSGAPMRDLPERGITPL
ncbi:MAG: hypothetical protein US51_C0012G0004 [Microgenomates group bacterium GW2011_GWA2_37_6]|nr:MAG: hypothetical protein US51_C0012G0004 [Microgenomates group bacterium GW2011_GWA2_37_6]